MIRLVTYSDESMSRSKAFCVESARKHVVEVAWANNPDCISTEFREFNPVLNEPRGNGYWLWKPYFILKAMNHCEEGDILIYSDAGIEFVNSVHYIIDRMDEDIFFFTNGFNQVEWCKADVMYATIPGLFGWVTTQQGAYFKQEVGFIEPEKSKQFKQVQASVIFFKVNQKTKDFAKEWLLYCQMPGFIDDSPSKLPNYPTFAEHRHDQSILTCLQIKYGYKLHFWPTNYSEHIRHTAQPEDNYPTIFNHHRKRDNEWK